ncbi:MAG: porin, partial [Thermoproteota archaeon]
AGVLALGYVAQTEAAQIKVDEDTFANFGLKMKVWYQNLDKRSKEKSGDYGDWRQNKFSVTDARIYFTGQINKLVQFYGQFDQDKSNKDSTSLDEAGINFAFAKEFQVLAGKIRKSFTRADISRSFTQLIPTSCFYDPQSEVLDSLGEDLINLFTYDDKKDAGLMVHGDLAGGMFT